MALRNAFENLGLDSTLQAIRDRLPSALGGSGGVKTEPNGNVASAATDSGNPVKVGGRFNSTDITLTDGQRGDLQLTSRGYLNVSLNPRTQGGSSVYRNINLGSTGQNIKSSNGQIYSYYIGNLASSVRYVKFYNKATAPTVGVDTPIMTYPIPANSAANAAFPNGVAFSLGIGIGATTGVADADTGAPAANDVVVNINYF